MDTDDGENNATNKSNGKSSALAEDPSKPSGFRMSLKTTKKKKPSSKAAPQTEESSAFFQASLPKEEDQRVSVQKFEDGTLPDDAPPLVIPVVGPNALGGGNRPSMKQEATKEIKQEDLDDEDAKAIQSLQQDAEDPNRSKSQQEQRNKNLVIAAAKDDFQRKPSQQQQEHRETQQFQQDLDKLPDAMDVDAYQQSRVPIAEFGAAMLRGMGWTGDNSGQSKNQEPSLPRPHRLGLGATPAPPSGLGDDDNHRRKPRTMDQYQRDKKLKQQAQEFARQRQKQVESDKQQTLQDGSLVLLTNGKRAKVAQLVGVPGLNQIRVQYERDGSSTEVKKGLIDGLLTRRELQDRPFVEGKPKRSEGTTRDDNRGDVDNGDNRKRRNDDEYYRRRKRDSGRHGKCDEYDDEYDSERRTRDDRRQRDDDEDRHNKKRRRKEEDRRDHASPKRKQSSNDNDRPSSSWVIPHIRVRIVTEKLGRRYFKEKGVVVDVTPKGSTVEMPSNSSSSGHRAVLDRVPERYLETALPKAGGRVVVLTASQGREYLYSKGTLLERGKGRGVVQLNTDKSVLTLSLDDLAEWLGPFEEDG